MERKQKWREVKDYALYYGVGREEELAIFDAAVVEPKGQTLHSLGKIQSTGTLVLCYVSFMEVHPWDSDFLLLREEDFLKEAGGYLKNTAFDTFLVDPRSERWARLLLHRIGKLLRGDGYDGIFLDTIGDVEKTSLKKEGAGLIMAAASLVNRIRQLYPEFLLIQNNGLEELLYYTTAYIDGICWENPPLARKDSSKWSKVILDHLEELQQNKDIRVMLLFEEGETGKDKEERDSSFLLAQKNLSNSRFLLYRAPNDYTEGINKS